MAEKTNKLSIYLIKEEYTKEKHTSRKSLLNSEKLKCEKIKDDNNNNVGLLYYSNSHVSEPSWIKKFLRTFNNKPDDKFKIFTASSKSVFIVTVEKRTFALAFGYGHTLLKPGVCEERFGLKVALSVIDREQMRSINKKNMSITPKLLIEQLTKIGTFENFGIDVEQDLIQGVTGKTKSGCERNFW